MRKEQDDMRVHHLYVSKTVRDYVERYQQAKGIRKTTDAVEQLLVRAMVLEGLFDTLSDEHQIDADVYAEHDEHVKADDELVFRTPEEWAALDKD